MFLKKTKQFVLLFNGILPKFCIPSELLEKYAQKHQKSTTQRVAFSCSTKLIPKNPFAKHLYIFDDFFFIEDDEDLPLREEYYIVGFQRDLSSCQNLIESFLNCEDEEWHSVDLPESSSAQTQRLDAMDLLFLKQFRLFFNIERNDSMVLYFFYPQLNLTVNCLKKVPKFVSIPLSEKLVQQKDKPPFDSITYGFLTLDSAKRVYPLSLEEKDQLQAYPICGVWVYGLHFNIQELEGSLIEQQRIWALMSQLMRSKDISLKISLEKNSRTFFFLNFSPKKSLQAFLVKVESGEQGKMTIKRDQFREELEQGEDFQEFSFSELFHSQSQVQGPEQEPLQSQNIKLVSCQSEEEQPKIMVSSGIQVDLKNSDVSEKSIID